MAERITEGRGSIKKIHIDEIPNILRGSIQPGDLWVSEVDRGGNNPIYWDTIIYRPSTKEFFKIRCHDGENGGYQPDIPEGKLPEGVVIEK